MITILSLDWHNGFYFFGCRVTMPDGSTKFWCDMQTKEMALETSRKFGLVMPEED